MPLCITLYLPNRLQLYAFTLSESKVTPGIHPRPLSVLILSYATYVLSEIIVVGVTFRATRHRKALAGALGHGKMSLSDVMFRDGAFFLPFHPIPRIGLSVLAS